jgi:DNA-binding NarL/FixJ family response regulator
VAKKQKPNAEPAKENSLAVEVGRVAKVFALYLIKDVKDEGEKILRLNGAGFSASEIAAMLGKTENNVRVTISKAKTKLNG